MKTPTPNKNLGQHWLHDSTALQAICDASHITPQDVVLEIGPGLGTLTALLATQATKVIAIELDQQLARELPGRVPADNLEVLADDILHFDLSRLPRDYKVVANVPYYITSKITRKFLESANPPTLMTLLVQKEVAQRMAAKPGDMSILAVAVQFYSKVSLGPLVPAALFTPPPQVDSQIITLERLPKPLFAVEPKHFFRIVRAGFSEKRKKLRNSLSGGLHLPKDVVENLLKSTHLPVDCRAEQLSMQDWHILAQTFKKESLE